MSRLPKKEIVQHIPFIDSHTAGEPTRVILSSPFEFSSRAMDQRRAEFARDFDAYRRAIVCEPRGNDVMVGALLTAPTTPESIAGVIFFNNVGMLGMCGHGTIGVAATLLYQGLIQPGTYRLDTPVGPVQFTCLDNGRVRVRNVPSYRWAADVPVHLTDGRTVHGDVAWGGNWFFICEDHGLQLELADAAELTLFCSGIRRALQRDGITGEAGTEIDHVELVGSPSDSQIADAKNFVLCPGGAYDRSPCGTGTSAKLACLVARRKLAPDAIYRQQGIAGGIFQASYQFRDDGLVEPTIEGVAHIMAVGDLLIDPHDPLGMGVRT